LYNKKRKKGSIKERNKQKELRQLREGQTKKKEKQMKYWRRKY
jgi:hypothetical protein